VCFVAEEENDDLVIYGDHYDVDDDNYDVWKAVVHPKPESC